jgi:hypothetical protein
MTAVRPFKPEKRRQLFPIDARSMALAYDTPSGTMYMAAGANPGLFTIDLPTKKRNFLSAMRAARPGG